MKRQKKTSYRGGRYPDIGRYVRLYSRKVGVGLVVGVTATGCVWPWHVDGDIAYIDTAYVDTGAIPGDIGETGEVYYLALPETGEHNLQFEEPSWGWIDYRVNLVVEDYALFRWLVDNPAVALAAVDAALATHPLTDFREYDGSAIIENEIKQALADAMAGAPGADTSALHEATLEIVHYTDENDIDGDIG